MSFDVQVYMQSTHTYIIQKNNKKISVLCLRWQAVKCCSFICQLDTNLRVAWKEETFKLARGSVCEAHFQLLIGVGSAISHTISEVGMGYMRELRPRCGSCRFNRSTWEAELDFLKFEK